MNESLDKDLIKRIEQDLKLYDLRQNTTGNTSQKKEMLIKDNDRDLSDRKAAYRTSDDLKTQIRIVGQSTPQKSV